jgi:hypothetical protein
MVYHKSCADCERNNHCDMQDFDAVEDCDNIDIDPVQEHRDGQEYRDELEAEERRLKNG